MFEKLSPSNSSYNLQIVFNYMHLIHTTFTVFYDFLMRQTLPKLKQAFVSFT